MQRIKYTVTSFLLGTILLATPVVASTPAPQPETKNAAAGLEAGQGTIGDNELYLSMKKKADEAKKIVIAKVDGAEISMLDLVRMMNRVAGAFYPNVTQLTDEITGDIKQRAVDRLLFEELAVQQAVRQGIKVTPEDVQKVIDALKEAYGSEEGYQGYLKEKGLNDAELRQQIERSRMLEGITGREVYQKVEVDNEAVQKLYNEYKAAGKLKKADEFEIKEILVMAGKDEQATRATAEKLLEQFTRNNHDFGKLVLDGTFIVRRLMVDKRKYPAVFAEMEGMQIGEFSGVVEDGGSFHIFEVVKKDPARDLTEEESKGMLADKLAYQFQEKKRVEWAEGLKKKAHIELFLDEVEKNLRKEAELAEKQGK